MGGNERKMVHLKALDLNFHLMCYTSKYFASDGELKKHHKVETRVRVIHTLLGKAVGSYTIRSCEPFGDP